MQNIDDLKYFLALYKTKILKSRHIKVILSKNLTFEDVYKNNIDLLEIFSKKEIEILKVNLKNIDLEKEVHFILKNNIQIVFINDENYPNLLRNIKYPPAVLFYKGNISVLGKAIYAIVGSRRISQYSKDVLNDFVSEEFLKKYVIVSGFARGVDSFAHALALERGGATIACLAYGLAIENIYPRENKKLYKRIIDEQSLLLSEYYPDQTILPQNFIQRNRLIAGLAEKVLIVEARQKSGSLSTARFALDYGRDLYVVPGNYFQDNFAGSNKLIAEGANILLKTQSKFKLNQESKTILDLLYKPRTFSELQLLTDFNFETLSNLLLNLEIEGKIKKKGIFYHY